MLRRPSRRTPYLGVLQAERAAHEPRGIVLILIRRQTLQIGHLRCVAGYMDNEIGRRDPRVVGRLTMGILERVYGLDHPYRPRLRRLGAVPVLQRCEKRKLV